MSAISVPSFIAGPMPGFVVPGPHETLAPALPDAAATRRLAVLYRELADLVARTPDPIVYAGDCLSIVGVVGGLQQRNLDPTVVFFDAHGDFNTWETTPSGFLGGMPLAMLTGWGEQTVVEGAGARPVDDTGRVVALSFSSWNPALPGAGIAAAATRRIAAPFL